MARAASADVTTTKLHVESSVASNAASTSRKSRFLVCAEQLCRDYFASSYEYHVAEKLTDDNVPNVRWFTATFSKPTPNEPVPHAVVRVTIEVVLEDGTCRASRFRGTSSSMAADVAQSRANAINSTRGRLLSMHRGSTRYVAVYARRDREPQVVDRKLAVQTLIPLHDTFTETRLPR